VVLPPNASPWLRTDFQHHKNAPCYGQDLAARGAKKQKEWPKNRGWSHFYNTVLDVCSNQGAKREMGGHRFQMGGRAPLPPPLATALVTAAVTKMRFFGSNSQV